MQPLDAKSDHWTTMGLTLLVWLCTLPLLALLVLPFFGWQVAGLVALGLLLILLPVSGPSVRIDIRRSQCGAICYWQCRC